MKLSSKFSGMLLSLFAIAIGIPNKTLAVEAPNIYDTAKEITVLVDGQNPGSGVIIAKKDHTYYVLTAKHVVATQDEYEIVTSDRQHYPLDYRLVKQVPNVDLAVIEFTSDREYRVAKVSDSQQAKPGKLVYIYGFPNPGREIKERIPQFTSGQITANSSLADGYGLVYTNVTRAGMSGGPVLDDRGFVIGIHGRAESEASLEPDESATNKNSKIGFNLGIPLDSFIILAKQAQINLEVESPEKPEKPKTFIDSAGEVVDLVDNVSNLFK